MHTLPNFCLVFQKGYNDLLELFINSEYDPERAEMENLNDCETDIKTIAKYRYLSSQVIAWTSPVINWRITHNKTLLKNHTCL